MQYRCESCGCIAGEYRWKAQGRKGRYAALHPEREVRGFHLNVLASSFCAWAGIVTEFLSAKEALDHGNPELMKVWVNTKLGETWEERGETADDMALLARREMYTATVPAQVLVLTCGIDVQDDRFELELVGWGVGKESWGIRYQKIYGDPLKPQIWEDLDKFLQTRWRREDGVVLDILAAAMDTGGHHTDSVYRFCLDRFYRHIYAIKGRGGTETPFVSKPSTGNRVGVPLYTIGVDNGKTMVYQRLNVQTEGPNYCHFPLNEAAGYDEVYFKGPDRRETGRPVEEGAAHDGMGAERPQLPPKRTSGLPGLCAGRTGNPQTLCWKTRRKKQKCRRLSVQQDAESYREVSDKWQASQKSRRKPSCKRGWRQRRRSPAGRATPSATAALTRADLYTVRGEIEYWDNKVKELEVAELRGRNRMYRFVLRDIRRRGDMTK